MYGEKIHKLRNHPRRGSKKTLPIEKQKNRIKNSNPGDQTFQYFQQHHSRQKIPTK